MATLKNTSHETSTASKSAVEKASEKVRKTTQNLANNAEDAAKASYDRVKEAIPSMEEAAGSVQDYVHERANVDLQKMADEAAIFVRRNPGTSLAAAAGLGILIGVAVSKRY